MVLLLTNNSGGFQLEWMHARKCLPSYQGMIKHMINRLNNESPIHSSFIHTLDRGTFSKQFINQDLHTHQKLQGLVIVG